LRGHRLTRIAGDDAKAQVRARSRAGCELRMTARALPQKAIYFAKHAPTRLRSAGSVPSTNASASIRASTMSETIGAYGALGSTQRWHQRVMLYHPRSVSGARYCRSRSYKSRTPLRSSGSPTRSNASAMAKTTVFRQRIFWERSAERNFERSRSPGVGAVFSRRKSKAIAARAPTMDVSRLNEWTQRAVRPPWYRAVPAPDGASRHGRESPWTRPTGIG